MDLSGSNILQCLNQIYSNFQWAFWPANWQLKHAPFTPKFNYNTNNIPLKQEILITPIIHSNWSMNRMDLSCLDHAYVNFHWTFWPANWKLQHSPFKPIFCYDVKNLSQKQELLIIPIRYQNTPANKDEVALIKNGDFHWSFSRANRQPIHAPITPIISFNMNHILPNQELLILTATHSTASLKMARFVCTMQGLFSSNLLISNTTTETHHIHVNHLTWLAQYSTNIRASLCPDTLFKLANKKTIFDLIIHMSFFMQQITRPCLSIWVPP